MPPPSVGARVVRAIALVVCVAMCVGIGFLGVGHGVGRELYHDTVFLFLAGKYWLAGLDAYTATAIVDPGVRSEIYDRYIMGYPPQASTLCMALAFGSMRLATVLMDALNVASLALLAWLAVVRIEETRDPARSSAHRWYVPALIVGNLSTAFVLWIGQTTLFVTAMLAGSWHAARRGRDVLAGVLLAVATIKPPLALFVALWFLLERRWRLIAATTGTIVLLALVPLWQHGPLGALQAWLGGVAAYMAVPYNALTSRMVFGLRSFLLALGVDAPELLPLGVAAVLALFAYRAKIDERDALGLLVGSGLLFGYAHGYDLAALVVLIPAFWCRLRGRPVAAAVALALLVGITFPNSVLEPLGSGALVHARVLLVVAALAWLVALDLTDAGRAGAGQRDAAAVGAALRWLPSTSRMP